MALAQTTLGSITQIQTAGSGTVLTVTGGKPVYVKSLLIHGLDNDSTNEVEIHVVPNNGGNVGTASSVNRIARVGLSTNDTYFFEAAYPITLVNNNDTIQCVNAVGSNAVNVIVLGDKEA